MRITLVTKASKNVGWRGVSWRVFAKWLEVPERETWSSQSRSPAAMKNNIPLPRRAGGRRRLKAAEHACLTKSSKVK